MRKNESCRYDVINQILFVRYIMGDYDVRFLGCQFKSVRETGAISSSLDDTPSLEISR